MPTLSFLKRAVAAVAGLLFPSALLVGQTLYVSPSGRDRWPGTERRPVATLARAQQLARAYPADQSVDIVLEDGVYYLPATLELTAADSRTYPARLTFRARHEGRAVVSGGQRLELTWREGADGIWRAPVPEGTVVDQLYVDGRRQRMARFPNAVPEGGAPVFDTWRLTPRPDYDPALDPLAPERRRRWKDPRGAYLHAMHASLWGDMHWRVTGTADGGDSLLLEGGWQNNRPAPMHPVFRMVENVAEELDAPGEWYCDGRELAFMPPEGVDLGCARIEVVRLRELVVYSGSAAAPVAGIDWQGVVFRHASRTFMENKEPLLRSDWTISRTGAVRFRGATDCALRDCEFDQVGGNAVFVDGFNRRLRVERCYIHHAGANGVAFVGDPATVRSPLFRYGPQDYARLDTLAGPAGPDYPMDCTVDDCLITLTGRDEKQTAGVQISMSRRITVSHCSIYDVPRAGINVSEGTFGGHLVEHCDVFNTVLETSDHGSFNSWGRDRFWTPDVATLSRQVRARPAMTRWDMVEPNVLRHNRWRCDHGWDVDLDDGSSHYRIYDNVLLAGGLKMREGYDRIATNNIILQSSLHPHVWPRQNGDVFAHNIVSGPYQPALMQADIAPDGHWGRLLDYNLFYADSAAMTRYRANGADLHSRTGAPLFLDPARGDYRVAPGSPALAVGFRNFCTESFGVRCPRLRRLAKTPLLPALGQPHDASAATSARRTEWLGARLKEVRGSELSAFGAAFDQAGLVVESVDPGTPTHRAGLRTGDLILRVDGVRTDCVRALTDHLAATRARTRRVDLLRNQEPLTLDMKE